MSARPRFHVSRFQAARLVLAAAMVASVAATLAAQAGRSPSDPRAYVTRTELEAQAAREEQAGRRESAAAIRERLRSGDFRVGDKVVVATPMTVLLPQEVAQALNDTFTVRAGRVILIPNMGEVSVDGLLRSELEPRLRAHLAQYLRSEPAVRVEPLMQVLISGPVTRQGYYPVAPDMLVTDVIMTGGPAATADVTRSTVRREGRQLISADSLQRAIRAGATLDRLDLRAGDEVVVGEKRVTNWTRIAQIVGLASSLGFLIYSIAR